MCDVNCSSAITSHCLLIPNMTVNFQADFKNILFVRLSGKYSLSFVVAKGGMCDILEVVNSYHFMECGASVMSRLPTFFLLICNRLKVENKRVTAGES